MRFGLSEEQQELKAALRKLLEREASEQKVRATAASRSGMDTALWRRLAEELGVVGIAVPEEYGGIGGSLVELGVVLEELGRALYVGPFMASALMASSMIEATGSEEAKSAMLPELAAGERILTLAIAEPSTLSWDPSLVETTATRDGDSWSITGAKALVPEIADADAIVVVARIGDGLGVFLIEKQVVDESVTVQPSLDITRRTGSLVLERTPATPISNPDLDVTAAIDTALARIAVGLSAEQLGGAERCLEMSDAYAKTREQFGVPIGSFQAIKHKCAEMLIACETTRSLVYHGLWQIAAGDEDAVGTAASAIVFANDSYQAVASENVQVHGGIGFTWEHPAHLYYKRAFADAVMTFDRGFRLQQIGREVLSC